MPSVRIPTKRRWYWACRVLIYPPSCSSPSARTAGLRRSFFTSTTQWQMATSMRRRVPSEVCCSSFGTSAKVRLSSPPAKMVWMSDWMSASVCVPLRVASRCTAPAIVSFATTPPSSSPRRLTLGAVEFDTGGRSRTIHVAASSDSDGTRKLCRWPGHHPQVPQRDQWLFVEDDD